jgi:hypothetical protein
MKRLLQLTLCLTLIFVFAACELVNPAFTITCTEAVFTADLATTTIDNSGSGTQIVDLRAYDGLNNLIYSSSYTTAVGASFPDISHTLFFSPLPLANPIRAEVMSPAGGDLAVDTVWFSQRGECAGLPYVTTVQPTPPPPPVPNARDINFDDQEAVHVSAPDALADSINIRILYENGSPVSDLYGAGTLGVEGLLALGVQQAVDIFSPSGLTYFEGGAVFCLRGSGALIWMPASQSPRMPQIIGSYSVPEWPGFTCATLFEPGTLVLVAQNPTQ